MILTDTHAHISLVAEELGIDVLESVLRAYAAAWAASEIEGRPGPMLVDIGVDPGDLQARLELLGGEGALSPFIRVAAGVWPSAENLTFPKASLDRLEAAIEEAERRGIRVAAIGEAGLDYHHMQGSAETQAELFEGQVALASALGLPLIVHSRSAAADTLSLVRSSSAPTIIHCFSYGGEEARAFLDLGCWISFAGNLTYKGSDRMREACAVVPEDKLLLETDSPYMNPVPHRGKSATPLDIERTYAAAAELRGVSVTRLGEAVSRNALSLFGGESGTERE